MIEHWHKPEPLTLTLSLTLTLHSLYFFATFNPKSDIYYLEKNEL